MHVVSDEKAKGFTCEIACALCSCTCRNKALSAHGARSILAFLSNNRGTSLGMRGQGGDVNRGQVGTDSRVSQRAVHPSMVRETHVRVVYDAESLQRVTIAQRSTLLRLFYCQTSACTFASTRVIKPGQNASGQTRSPADAQHFECYDV